MGTAEESRLLGSTGKTGQERNGSDSFGAALKVFVRLLISFTLSTLLIIVILLLRLLAFKFGYRFDGPVEVFGWLGILAFIFILSLPLFFFILTKRLDGS